MLLKQQMQTYANRNIKKVKSVMLLIEKQRTNLGVFMGCNLAQISRFFCERFVTFSTFILA